MTKVVKKTKERNTKPVSIFKDDFDTFSTAYNEYKLQCSENRVGCLNKQNVWLRIFEVGFSKAFEELNKTLISEQ